MNKYQEALDKIRRKLTVTKITTVKLFGKKVKAYKVHIDYEEEIKILQELINEYKTLKKENQKYKDKATPKKPIRFKDKFYMSPPKCPTCKTIPHTGNQRYCDECGQLLDWSDE